MVKKWLPVLLLTVVALLSAGCEKTLLEESALESPSKGNVVLRLSAYEQMDFSTRGVQDIALLCRRVNVAFFQNGTKVLAVSQSAGDGAFGTVSATLPEGTCQVVVMAHNSDGSATISSEQKVTFPSNQVSDTFYYYGSVEVGGSQRVYDLVLRRAVSMFRLDVVNALPAAAAKIRFYYTGGSSTFSPSAGYGCVNSRQTVMMPVEAGQTVFDVYTFPHEESDVLKMLVTVYTAEDNILKEQTFEEVPVTRNRITKYTGDFFSSSASMSGTQFRLSGNGDWDGTDAYSF